MTEMDGREQAFVRNRSLETPEEDAVEQHAELRDDEQSGGLRTAAFDIPFDVNEADAADQHRLVELDEDDYR